AGGEGRIVRFLLRLNHAGRCAAHPGVSLRGSTVPGLPAVIAARLFVDSCPFVAAILTSRSP
ncbi:MAG: hypothetical protein ACK5ES_06440, partial [Planctomyces sp.]